MAKTKISEWSTTPASNTDIDGINIAEGCAPSGINDAIRDLMAQVRSWQSGASGDPFNGPMNGTIGATTTYSGAFTTLSASGTTTLSGLTASTALALDASKNVVSVANTGSGSNVLATSPTLVTPALGTPSSATLTNATGLPISTGVSGLGTGVATALGVAVGSAGAPVVNGGALGTPSSGTVTNLTGTASININGTVGATTPTTGAFTTTTVSTSETLSYGTANGVTYLNGSKVLTSGSALVFDGTNLSVGTTALSGGKFSTLADLTAVNGLVIRDSATTYANNDNYVLLQNSTGATAGGLTHPASQSLGVWGVTDIQFVMGTGATEQMRLTSTGLGIGTSSPAYKLDVNGNINTSFNFILTGSGTLQQASQSAYTRVIGGTTANTDPTLTLYGSTNGNSGLITYDGSSHRFRSASGSTEYMRLDSAGNLGLGVTPKAWGSGFRAMEYGNWFNLVQDSSGGSNMNYNGYFNGTNYLYINNGYALQYKQYNGAHQWYTAASGTAGNAISFTQAATLDASGNYLLGATSQVSNERLSVVTGNTTGMLVKTTGGATYVPIYSWNATTTGDGYFAGFFTEATATFRGSITYNRTAGLVAYNTTSDYRAKDISGPVTNSGELIDSVPVYMGTMKGATQERPMFIAHETPAYAHTGEKDAVDADGNPVYQQMDASALIPVMWAEIQSLRQRVATLEAK